MHHSSRASHRSLVRLAQPGGANVRVLALGSTQASIIEVDLLDGGMCDGTTALNLLAIGAHYAEHGELLVTDPRAMFEELTNIANGFDDAGESRMRDAATALAGRVLRCAP